MISRLETTWMTSRIALGLLAFLGRRGQVLKRFDELGAVREPVRCTDAALQRNYIHAYRGRD
jgi:hypothetical protein